MYKLWFPFFNKGSWEFFVYMVIIMVSSVQNIYRLDIILILNFPQAPSVMFQGKYVFHFHPLSFSSCHVMRKCNVSYYSKWQLTSSNALWLSKLHIAFFQILFIFFDLYRIVFDVALLYLKIRCKSLTRIQVW